MSLTTQDILDSMEARKPRAEKLGAFYSSPNSAVNKFANMIRVWNIPELWYDAESLDATFERTIKAQVERIKKSVKKLS